MFTPRKPGARRPGIFRLYPPGRRRTIYRSVTILWGEPGGGAALRDSKTKVRNGILVHNRFIGMWTIMWRAW